MASVLDASALLAFLLEEPGKDRVMAAVLDGTVMTTVNLGEVAARYALRGAPEEAVRGLRRRLPIELVPVDVELCIEAALMAPATRRGGLSMGDRICLALAKRLGVAAVTADRAWAVAGPAVGVRVELIR